MSLHPGVSQFPKKHREEPYKILVEAQPFDRLRVNGN
jgi:hypothetical protein